MLPSTPERIRRWYRAFAGGHRSWVFKTLAMNAVGSVVDYSIVLLGTWALSAPPAMLTATGLASGALVSFLLNRRYTFADAEGSMTPQAIRYALAIGVLLLAHSFAITVLCNAFGVHVVAAKVVADLSVIPIPQAILMRRFVFPTRTAVAAPARPPVPVSL